MCSAITVFYLQYIWLNDAPFLVGHSTTENSEFPICTTVSPVTAASTNEIAEIKAICFLKIFFFPFIILKSPYYLLLTLFAITTTELIPITIAEIIIIVNKPFDFLFSSVEPVVICVTFVAVTEVSV